MRNVSGRRGKGFPIPATPEGSVPDEERPDSGVDWTFLTYDLEMACAECQEPMHAGQAVGHVSGRMIHAKCFKAESDG